MSRAAIRHFGQIGSASDDRQRSRNLQERACVVAISMQSIGTLGEEVPLTVTSRRRLADAGRSSCRWPG
jgi:hypothetical protein